MSMDRREFLTLASAMGLTLGAGLSVPTISAAATAAGQPKRGGTLKFPVDANVTPWPPIALLQNLLVNKSIFNALLRYSPDDWSPQPDLAEKWESSKDGLTWTFHLRKDARWHDGKPFTAEDVKFTLDLFRDPKVASVFRGSVISITRVEVASPYTVKMVTETPNSALPEVLGYLIFMLPKHLLEGGEYNPTKFPQEFIKHPIGTGPFKFAEHIPGDHFTVVANDNYHEGRPYLDSIIFKVVRDGNSLALPETSRDPARG